MGEMGLIQSWLLGFSNKAANSDLLTQIGINMSFQSEAEAKEFALYKMVRRLQPSEIEERLDSLRSYYAHSPDQNYLREINNLEQYVESQEFQSGDYPRGIDELILELVEWRAAIHAFDSVETKKNAFNKHPFFAQWLVGGTYAIFCLLGILVSKDNRDNSLRELWLSTSKFVHESGLCDEKEIKVINEILHAKDGRFTNTNSLAIKFRNKVVAHNEHTFVMEWPDLDKDLRLLVRIWHLISCWISCGMVQPFRDGSLAFSGLEGVFLTSEIRLFQSFREEYLNRFRGWCNQEVLENEQE